MRVPARPVLGYLPDVRYGLVYRPSGGPLPSVPGGRGRRLDVVPGLR